MQRVLVFVALLVAVLAVAAKVVLAPAAPWHDFTGLLKLASTRWKAFEQHWPVCVQQAAVVWRSCRASSFRAPVLCNALVIAIAAAVTAAVLTARVIWRWLTRRSRKGTELARHMQQLEQQYVPLDQVSATACSVPWRVKLE